MRSHPESLGAVILSLPKDRPMQERRTERIFHEKTKSPFTESPNESPGLNYTSRRIEVDGKCSHRQKKFTLIYMAMRYKIGRLLSINELATIPNEMTKRIVLTIVFSGMVFLFLNKELSLTPFDIPFFSVPFGKSRVDFVNNSERKINRIDFVSVNIRASHTNIKKGERVSQTFNQDSEGLYQFRVVFEEGDTLVSDERYIEGGYFMKEYINSDNIETEF